MNQPKTIRSGFKSPPLERLKGRGPPTTKKRDSFLIWIHHPPPLYPIFYMKRKPTVKGLKKGIYAAEVSANCTYRFLSPVLECSWTGSAGEAKKRSFFEITPLYNIRCGVFPASSSKKWKIRPSGFVSAGYFYALSTGPFTGNGDWGSCTKRKTPHRYDPTGASNVCKNEAYAFASAVFSSVFGVAFAAMARALRPFLLRAFPNDPRARLPFSVLLSPRPIGRSFHIHCYWPGFSFIKSCHYIDCRQ